MEIEIETAKNVILSEKSNISEKMRALFKLRHIDSDESVFAISKAFVNKSILLKHELAYVLGQMQRDSALSILEKVLCDEDENEIVRHEAAEALANFKHDHIPKILSRFVDHKSRPIRETCFIGLEKLKEDEEDLKVFCSIDPAYPIRIDFNEAERIFLDKNSNIYLRYKVMFFLRDLATERASKILIQGFEDESELFKHEIAFVLGQLRAPETTEALAKVLSDDSQHEMVRHECAEALGNIGTDEAKKYLLPFLSSKIDIVRESVEVALDIHQFVNDDENEYCVVEVSNK